MTDCTLREYTPADVPALSMLWREVFGDPLRMTAELFALLPDMGSCVVAERDGRLLGAATVLNGFELVTRQKKRPRSIASGVLLHRLAAGSVDGDGRLGAGLGNTGSIRDDAAVGAAGLGLDAVCPSSTEYLHWRDALLRGKAYLRPSNPTMEFARRFCACFGGGLYACGSGICAAYLDGETCIIKELVTRAEADAPVIAASVGAFLGAKTAVWYLPAREGEAYIAAAPGSIPADCVWNLSFD